MLDAAHGEAVRTKIAVLWIHITGSEVHVAYIGSAGCGRRRSPVIALGADASQCSRRAIAVARSRRVKAITRMNAEKGAAQTSRQTGMYTDLNLGSGFSKVSFLKPAS